jgi:putative hydrolase of the HAD superfamily
MGNSQVKAVLWDFGGVLSTSPFDAFRAYEEANGLEAGFIRQLNATNPDVNAWARFERSEVSQSEFARLYEAEALAVGARIDASDILAALSGQLRPEMIEAVRRCRARLKTGLLTNNFVKVDLAGDEPVGMPAEILELFDAIVESSKVGYRKPDPHFYAMACDLLEIEPADAVFLDDLGVNLKPARAMGMHTIKVTDPDAALRELQGLVGFPLT